MPLQKLLSLFRPRNKTKERIDWLLSKGRVVEGVISEVIVPDNSNVNNDSGAAVSKSYTIRYEYCVAGVSYEGFHELTADQTSRLEEYQLGTTVSVRYDPRTATSSVIV